MKVFELVGVPGAGKSYILTSLKKKYGVNDRVLLFNDLVTQFMLEKFIFLWLFKVLPSQIQNKIFYKIYTYFKYNLKFQEIFKLQYSELINYIKDYNVNRPIKPEHKEKIIEWFYKTGEYYILSEKIKSKGIFIIDEGFVQRVSSLFVSELEVTINNNDIVHYLDLIPKMSKLIFIERSLEECLKSRIKNPGYRLRGLKVNEIKEVLNFNQQRLKFAFNFMRDKNGVSNLFITNS